MRKLYVLLLFLTIYGSVDAQSKSSLVNVFLGSSGDNGQMSPAASAPFTQMSILPQTDPYLHMGYEHYAKKVLGFTHNRFEGVGCRGSGGLILIKPFLKDSLSQPLIKQSEAASPGAYTIHFTNGVNASFGVWNDIGIHHYTFPRGKKGLLINLEHTFNNAFAGAQYTIANGFISGTVSAKTTCHAGTYKIHFAIEVPENISVDTTGNTVVIKLPESVVHINLRIAFSSVNPNYAISKLNINKHLSIRQLQQKSSDEWNNLFNYIEVEGNEAVKKLFYSLLYRTLQSPFKVSEKDGRFAATDGNIYTDSVTRYHGWAIWDNYKTQLPLLELLYPLTYQHIITSIADLYRYGKYDFAGENEPANSVRTEHAAVVLADAVAKGYQVDVNGIKEKVFSDTSRFDFSKPDKFLEATYDFWAMAKLYPEHRQQFLKRAADYKTVWLKEFKDLTLRDVDRMSARNMYQGTIRQYRWNVPFDVKGLIELAGGKEKFTEELDDFFDNHYYNRANEPDIQSPTMYNASNHPSKYQYLIHHIALDSIVQYYFNENLRGIEPSIDRLYKNQPKAYIRTMDDDAGAMSGWFVLSAIGLHQPLIGEPVYYLSVPFFESVKIKNEASVFTIRVNGYHTANRYIKRVTLNGKDLGRIWITRDEIRKGGTLVITASAVPTAYGKDNIWISEMALFQ
ncbi:glycoside hydrolase domain-containing protein [Gynurincola endophyticus]|uniref:glycoside hydrolase domain-containing protein n=1 Tax=Gynurincola endophyticus TaxID=2479004 RepID=UPI000F8F647F|nr:glycoside hydrolase domain-containing protein [Gynurincola endophyticus]